MTARQKEILDLIRAGQRRAGPSAREIAAKLGVATNVVQRIAGVLRASGEIEPDAGDGLVVRASVRAATPAPEKAAPCVRVDTARPRAPLFKPSGRL